ncbi:hypothetical protein BV898_18294 [Hypsibius exemplaris]|uniref:Uncharacterized protein n=1 Tax=Hypsibius exemplaris TaxID=2072580 RepID=A0A9X6NHB4_HYPEX|nr:hypothetical protein BV898_18294 [Hypsibius exemplaris]
MEFHVIPSCWNSNGNPCHSILLEQQWNSMSFHPPGVGMEWISMSFHPAGQGLFESTRHPKRQAVTMGISKVQTELGIITKHNLKMVKRLNQVIFQSPTTTSSTRIS